MGLIALVTYALKAVFQFINPKQEMTYQEFTQLEAKKFKPRIENKWQLGGDSQCAHFAHSS